jgi:hypothetical protein
MAGRRRIRVVCRPQNQQTHYHHATNNAKTEADHITKPETTDDRLAQYTLWLAIFTGVLSVSTIGLWFVTWRGGIRQSADMQATIALARDEFNATHRPKLIVRRCRDCV